MNGRKVTSDMISRMAVRSLKAGRLRNIFVMITIVLASSLLTAILMFAAGGRQQEKNELSHRHQVVYFNLDEEQVHKLEKDDRIAYQIRVKTGILSGMEGFDLMPYYVSEMSDQIRFAELESGRMPESANEVAVYGAMLEKMNIAPAIGGSVTFQFYDGNTETFLVSGILKGGEALKQFSAFFSENYAEDGSQLKDEPYEVYAKVGGAAEMSPEQCREVMYQIGSDAGIERKYVNPSKLFMDSLSLDTQSVMLYGIVGLVILLACFLVIYGVFYLSVTGRVHQFGQLRTIGMTKKQMKKFVFREGGILFVRAAPIGILTGGIVGYFLIPDGFDPWNTLLTVVSVSAAVYAITMISVHRPARMAADVSPMEALRYIPQEIMRKKAHKKMCRNLTPTGLGMMNFSKNGKKAVITMFSLAFGGILFMTAATYMSSFDREKYARQGWFKDAEFNIQYSAGAIELNEYGLGGLQAEAALGAETVREILSLDGVREVKEVKSFGVRYDYPEKDEYGANDQVYPLTEAEINELHKYLEDESIDYEKLMSGDYILMAGNSLAEEIYGWKFEAGESITLHYYDGGEMAEKNVTILAILSDRYLLDNDGFEGWFLMPEQAVLSLVSYDSLNSHLIVSTEAEREAAIGEILAQMTEKRPELTLETLAERRIYYAQIVNQMFGVISGLSIFIMMFSIFSMINTLITNVVTRRQELAVLESIGMGKGQIRKMLLGESLFLVFVTVGVTMTVGTVCGYMLSRVLCGMGAYYMEFRFPAVLFLAYAGVLISVPLVITLVSVRSFSKEALVERLRGAEN